MLNSSLPFQTLPTDIATWPTKGSSCYPTHHTPYPSLPAVHQSRRKISKRTIKIESQLSKERMLSALLPIGHLPTLLHPPLPWPVWAASKGSHTLWLTLGATLGEDEQEMGERKRVMVLPRAGCTYQVKDTTPVGWSPHSSVSSSS